MKLNKIYSLAFVCLLGLGLFACGDNQSTQTMVTLPTLTPTATVPADNPKVISPANADKVVELQRLGYGMVTELDISPDDSKLAVASTTGVQVYDLDTLEMIFKSDDVWSDSVDWSPDSRFLVSAHYDGSLNLWDAATGELLLTQTTPHDPIKFVAWSPDGKRIATNGAGFTQIWAAKTLELIVEHEAPRDSWIEWTSDSEYLAFHDSWIDIVFLNLHTGEFIFSDEDDIKPYIGDDIFINGKTSGFGVKLISKEGTEIVEKGVLTKEFFRFEGEQPLYYEEGNFFKYNLITKELTPLIDYGDILFISGKFEWNSDLTIFVFRSKDGSIKIVDLRTVTVEVLGEISGFYCCFDHLAWSPDKTKLGISRDYWEQNIYIWDMENDVFSVGISKFHVWENEWCDPCKEIHHIGSLLWPSDEEFLVSNGINSYPYGVLLWNGITGEVVFDREGLLLDGGYVDGTQLSPDGKLLAVQSFWDRQYVIDLDTGDFIFDRRLNDYCWIHPTAWSKDSKLFAIFYCEEQMVRVWDVVNDLVYKQWEVKLPQSRDFWVFDLIMISMSYDNSYLAGRDGGGDLWIWDTETGEERYVIERATEKFVSSIAWSPVMPLLAFNTPDGLVIWDIETNSQAALLTGFNGGIEEIAWSPDGTQIATIGEDHTIRIWGLGE